MFSTTSYGALRTIKVYLLKYQVQIIVTMSQRRKSRSAHLNRKPIDLSEICYDSTCITLNIPQSLACLTCEPKICIHTKKGRQQKALERLKDDRNKCDQLWLTKVVSNQKCPTSKLIRHNEVRAYLGIESDVILQFSYHNKSTETKANPAFEMYIKMNFLPLPSNNQCVEAGVKDAALCRTSGRSERIASLLNFFRSTITTYVVNDARAVAITDPQKERGVKRKANDNENRHKIWISESSKVHSILKHANKFNPDLYSLEQKRIMTLKVGTTEHYSTEQINKSDLKFRQKMNKQKIQNTAQQKVGVDTTPYLLGKIQYGKLRSLHVNLMRDELLHRTTIPIDNSLGIRALAALLRTHENERVGNTVNYFMPQLNSAPLYQPSTSLSVFVLVSTNQD